MLVPLQVDRRDTGTSKGRLCRVRHMKALQVDRRDTGTSKGRLCRVRVF